MASNDPRFSAMHSAPIFKKQKRDKFKVKVDDRFKGVMTDDRFRVQSSDGVDAYGRKKSKSKASSAKDELKEFYEIEEDNEETSSTKKKSGSDPESRLDYLNRLARGEISGSSSDSDDSSSEDGEGDNASGDSSSDNDSDDDEGMEDPFAVPGDEVEYAGDNSEASGLIEDSRRLAIQNCDWEKVTAEDLFTILQSFCPSGGAVRRVTVYPSDFGLQQLEQESLHGPPKEIWKKTRDNAAQGAEEDDSDESEESDDDEEEESSGEEDAEEEEGSDDDSGSDTVLDIEDMQKPDGSTKVKGADFIRPASKTGLVVDLNYDSDDDDGENGSAGTEKKKASTKKASSDIDTVALRAYELSKLRYYFAIAEFDNSETANHLYKELDGMEFEHSSMAMDLRFVPSDTSFEDRKQRDMCTKTSVAYNPPNEFVVDALQRTNVDCSWETEDAFRGDVDGKRGGAKGATTASQWRELAESDMQQYLANSSSSESEGDSDQEEVEVSVAGSSDEGEDSDGDGGPRKKKRKMSKKAAKLRQLLLGGDGSDSGDEQDDFFLDDDMSDEGLAERMREGGDGDGDSDGDGAVDKVFTFVPEGGDSGDEKALRKRRETESPAEALKRQRAAKKKAKRESKGTDEPAIEDGVFGESTAASQKVSKKKNKKNRGSEADEPLDEEGKKQLQNLELMFAGDEGNGGTDRLRYSKKEFEKATKNKKKGKKKRSDDDTVGDDFKVDLNDDRFGAVLGGTNPNFGIDPLSNEFRPTDAMKKILQEQQVRRRAAREQKQIEGGSASAQSSDANHEGEVDVNQLVKKLKAKSAGTSNRKRLR